MGAVRRTLWLAAAVLGVAAVVESLVRYADSSSSPQYTLFACLLALATTLPLGAGAGGGALQRRPAIAAGAMAVASVLSLSVVGTLTIGGGLAQLGVAYRLGRRGAPPVAVALGLPYLVLAIVEPGGYRGVVAVVLAALTPTAILTGTARRTVREAARTSAAQQELAGTLLEHTARGERARIARELHDVVAHHISMIAVQAETARLATPGMPAAGAQRLSAIGDTARDALTEMRRLLGVLRQDSAVETRDTGPVPRQPQPGLRQLNELLDEARDASGAGTRLILHGAPVPLDPGVELAAYRIVQEALTNARRHAARAAVDVELYYGDSALGLVIRDNGPGAAARSAGGAGLGLVGMRERAAAVGGTLRAGPATGGGFLVRATLPVKATLPVTSALPANAALPAKRGAG
jgi:signal transduction histidine kinase